MRVRMPSSKLRSNAIIIAIVALAHVFQLFVLPLTLLHWTPAAAWLTLPLAALSLTLWALLHEAIHHNLATRAGVNVGLGRALAILHGSPFRVLQVGHLLHHRYSRTVRERTEVYDASRTTRLRVAPAYYARLLGGLYFGELLANLLCFLPARTLAHIRIRVDKPDSVLGALVGTLASPPRLREVRIDALLVISIYGASAAAYGAYWPVLVGALCLRALLISLNDNVYHYGTALDDERYAKNLAAPRALSALMLNFNLHGAHHEDPRLAWQRLPAKIRASGTDTTEPWLRAVIAQLRGPLAAEDLQRAATSGRSIASISRIGSE
jgi:fatty acid desaturase